MRDANCTKCPLFEDAKTVCLWGRGPSQARVMLVGQNPGREEDKAGEAFIGKSGQLLASFLRRTGFDPDEVYISNAIKCFTKGNAKPSGKSVTACRDYLVEEVQSVRPEYIIALGDTALVSLTGKSGISKKHGIPQGLGSKFEMPDTRVVPIYHPAYALYNPGIEPTIITAFSFVKGLLDGTAERVAPKIVWFDEKDSYWHSSLVFDGDMSFDIETNALDFDDPEFKVRLIGIDNGEEVRVFGPSEKGLAVGVTLLEGAKGSAVGHNSVRFDTPGLGVVFPVPTLESRTEDTMLLAYLQDENVQAYGLEACAHRLIGSGEWKSMVTWDWKDPDEAIDWKKAVEYNAADCRATWLLWQRLKNEVLEDEGLAKVYEVLKMATRAFSEMENNGVYIIDKNVQAARVEILDAKEKALAELRSYAGDGFNPASVKQVATMLYGTYGLPVIMATDSGAPSTDELTVKTLAQNLLPDIQAKRFVNALLDYRENAKLLSTYIDSFSAKAALDLGNRIYPGYSTIKTVTGRSSSFSPNIQNVPRDLRVRAIIGAPEGFDFFQADYSQLELRMAAHVFDEKNMRAAFERGEDLHRLLAAKITGKNPEDVTYLERTELGKVPNFALLYCAEIQTFMDYAFKTYGIQYTASEAKEIRDTYYRMWPGLEDAYQRISQEIMTTGQVRSVTGQIRRLPAIFGTNTAKRLEALRMGINFAIQNPSAHFAFVATSKCVDVFKERPYFGKAVAFVHDAFQAETTQEFTPVISKIVKEIMEKAVPKFFSERGFDMTVPLIADVGVGPSWGSLE